METKKGIIDIDGFQLNYSIEGKGVPVLCVGSAVFYSRVFSSVLKEKLQMIFIDHCGFVTFPDREVSNNEFKLENLIRHIEFVRSELVLEQFFILGHSGHAFMALEYAKKYPNHILGTILIAVSPNYSEQSHSLTDNFFIESASEGRKSYFEKEMGKLPSMIQDEPEKRFVHFCLCSGAKNWYNYDFDATHLWEGVETNMQMIDYVWGTVFRDIDITENLTDYSIPTLLMLGKYDYVTGPAALWDDVKQHFKNLEITVFEKSGHYPMHEQSLLFDTELLKWINKETMKIEQHNINNTKIAELISDSIILQTSEDGLDLLGDLYYQGFDRVIIHEKNITPEFFNLKNKMAGEILQKFSNYRIRLVVVGDFTMHTGKSITDFIRESNRGKTN